MNATKRCLPVLMMARELGFGGIERDVSRLARHLPKFGIAPHVACFRPGGIRWREIEAAGIPMFPMPLTSFRSRAAIVSAINLKRYLRENDIQVVHAFDDSSCIFGVTLARMFGTPVTLSSHLGYRDFSPSVVKMILALVDRLATGVYVNCHAMARHLAEEWKHPAGEIHVCHNGFEPEEFHPIGRQRPANIKDATVVFGTVALLREEKNLPMLIDAFADVHKTDSRARLVIVGSGVLKTVLEKRIEHHHIGDACTIHEASATPAEWMRAIDVFVLPSRSEAFSNSLLEAMACGCCPVASQVGGLPEMISHGERGYLFEAGNLAQLTATLKMLLLNRSQRESMGAAAAFFAQKHLTIDIAASRLASIYKKLVVERSGGEPCKLDYGTDEHNHDCFATAPK